MTISIPTAFELVSTNLLGLDETPYFDNTVSNALDNGSELQEENKVYINTGGGYTFPAYSAGAHAVGDFVFKDGYKQRIESLTEASNPKQPDEYTAGPDTSLDEADWQYRYLKFDDVALGETDNKTLDSHTNGPTHDIEWGKNGTKMYEMVDKYIYEYDASEAYDLESCVANGNKITFGSANITGFKWNGDGTKMIITDWDNDRVYEYVCDNLLNPWSCAEINGTSHTDSKYVHEPDGIAFSSDFGTMLIIRNNGIIRKSTLTGDFDLGTEIDVVEYDHRSDYNDVREIELSSDDKKLFIGERDNNAIVTYTMPTALDIANMVKDSTLFLLPYTAVNGFCFGDSGTKLYVIDDNTNKMYQYYVPTPFILGTASQDVFPIVKTETRDSVEYIYTISRSGNTYSFESSRGGIVNTYPTMTVFTSLTLSSTELEAVIGDNGTWLAKTMIWNNDGIYLRTNQDIAVEYDTPSSVTTKVLEKIEDLPDFVYIRDVLYRRPFNNKQYSTASTEDHGFNTITYRLRGLAEFDTIGLGNLIADTVTVEFKEADGTVVTTVTKNVDSTRDADGYLDRVGVTEAFYSDSVMSVNDYVDITMSSTLTTDNTSIGAIIPAISINTGFTDLAMTHKYKDFSSAEYDVWGNLDYVERESISVYSGSVSILIENYDRTDRMMRSLGKTLIILNGSDSDNIDANGTSIFASTIRIGRIMTFQQQTKVKDNDLDRTATYTFTLEELI